MKDYSMRFIFDRKNETGFKGRKQGKKYKETGLLQIEVRRDGTDKRVYVSTNIHIRPLRNKSSRYTAFIFFHHIHYITTHS